MLKYLEVTFWCGSNKNLGYFIWTQPTWSDTFNLFYEWRRVELKLYNSFPVYIRISLSSFSILHLFYNFTITKRSDPIILNVEHTLCTVQSFRLKVFLYYYIIVKSYCPKGIVQHPLFFFSIRTSTRKKLIEIQCKMFFIFSPTVSKVSMTTYWLLKFTHFWYTDELILDELTLS